MKAFRTFLAATACAAWVLSNAHRVQAQEPSDQEPGAQEPGGQEGMGPEEGNLPTPTLPAPGGGVIYTPGSTSVTTTTTPPFGFPAPGANPNANLPSSSQPTLDTSRSSDGFDLSRSSGGAQTLRGSRDAPAILAESNRMSVPQLHTVKKGDTLWDLCGAYYQNPWRWPEVWSYNPQLQNPHWIYPGDQLRIRRGGTRRLADEIRTANGFLDRTPSVPPGTIFLKNHGFLGDPKRDTLGMLVGSREDQMLLSTGNTVYLKMRPGVDLAEGQELTVFRDSEQPPRVAGARNVPGRIVAVKGTLKITHWDPKKRIARGRVLEAFDVIERGAKVGPVGRRFEVVPPKASTVTLSATVLTSFYPHVHLGKGQLAFIDRGAEDGLQPGNRLRLVRRGDAWRRSLSTTHRMVRTRVILESPVPAQYETVPIQGNEQDFPEEILGEVQVLRTQKQSSLVLITESAHELVPGDRVVATQGH